MESELKVISFSNMLSSCNSPVEQAVIKEGDFNLAKDFLVLGKDIATLRDNMGKDIAALRGDMLSLGVRLLALVAAHCFRRSA